MKRGDIEPDVDGSFHSKRRAQQLFDFEGIRFNFSVRPTDIDASIDFGDGTRGFIFFEVKYKDNAMDIGQRRHLEALCNNLKSPSIALCVSHNISNPNQNVFLKHCIVREAYVGGKWVKFEVEKTALEVANYFVRKHCPEYLND